MKRLVLSVSLLVVGCGSRAPVEVTLETSSFATSGSNLFNCSTPAQPANPRGIQTGGIGCEPQRNADGTFSTTPVVISTVIGCGDGNGAVVTVSCMGNGKDQSISGTVTLSIAPSCSSSAQGVNPATFAFQDIAPGGSQTSPPLSTCAVFDDLCTASDPCAFNELSATVTVTHGTP